MTGRKVRQALGSAPRSSITRSEESVLEEPGVRSEDPPEIDETASLQAGTQLGRYVVLFRVGGGGMGVVYAAYDPELDRKVALKLLRPTAGVDEEQRRRRLIREARALAKLSHPNVVAVHDVGTVPSFAPGGTELVFLAMEFVDGTTLSAWSKARTRPWREVLEPMLAAGRGLAAAHAAGLVHRDFKPDNVMVGSDGRIRVMDFGLVRPDHDNATPVDTGDDGPRVPDVGRTLTEQGSIVGTPAYMAPEQHLGGATDARADQFSFCVALWEALYGERPFRGETIAALAHAVIEGRIAEPPSSADVPVRIRRVILRGLATDPTQRHPDMDALLADLARDTSAARRRWWAAGGLGIAVAGVLGGTQLDRMRRIDGCEAAAAAIAEVWNDGARAQVRTGLLATGTSYAEATWDRIHPHLDEHAATWSDVRHASCIAAEVDRTRDAMLASRTDDCLQESRDAFASAVDALTHAEAELVRGAVRLVSTMPEPARCTDDAALGRRPAYPDDPAARAAIDELRHRLVEVRGLRAAGRHRDALALARPVQEEAEALGWGPLRVEAVLAVGDGIASTGDPAAAVELFEQAFDLAVREGHDDATVDALARLVYINGNELHEHDRALSWARVGEPFLARVDPDEGVATAQLLTGIAAAHRGRGAASEALPILRRALAIRERELGPDHVSTIEVENNIAVVQIELGEAEEASATMTRVVAARERTLGPDHPDVASALNVYGAAVSAVGDFDGALASFERALAIYERAYGPDHPKIAVQLHNIGSLHRDRLEVVEAIAAHERELAIRERAATKDPHAIGRALQGLGAALADHGDLDRAIPMLQRAHEQTELALGPDHPDVGLGLDELGLALRRGGNAAAALPLHRRALAIRERAYGRDHVDVGVSLMSLGHDEAALGDDTAALAYFARAIAIHERANQQHNLAASWHAVADIQRRRGHVASAVGSLERALAVEEQRFGAAGIELVETLLALVDAELARGGTEAAARHAGRAAELARGADVEQRVAHALARVADQRAGANRRSVPGSTRK